MLTPDQIAALQANATPPQSFTGQKTKWVNGQLVLNDQESGQLQKKKKGNFLTSLLPTGGGIAGGAAGAAIGTAILPGVGTLAGALLGGALGGGAGKVGENAIEGENLGSGVAQEAALNGVFSAGPLRLLKLGSEAVKGVRAGTGLADALKTGGTAAQDMSLLRGLGNRVSKTGEGMIAKEFRLNPTQQSNFKNLHGEDATAVLRRYKINDPEQVRTAAQPLQDAFDSVIQTIPNVSKDQLSTGLKSVYEPLLKSPALFEKGLGEQVKTQADELMKLAKGGSLPAAKVNELRKTFDSAVSYTQKGAPEYNVIKKTADALRGTLQNAADTAGVKTADGLTFKQVGQELRKLYGLDEVVGKQAYLGTGSLPLSIGNLPGIITGAGAAGIPGAVAGYAANAAINSTAGRRVAADATMKLGEKLATRGAINVGSAYGVNGIAKRVAPVGIAGALSDGYLSEGNNMPTTAMTNSATTTPMTSNIDGSYQNPQQDANQGSLYPLENAIYDAQRDPKNADYYMKLYEFANPKPADSGLNSTTATQVASSANATNTLDQLQGLFGQAGGGSGKLGGTLQNALAGIGLNGDTQTYNDLAASSVSQLARALNGGGQVSDADAAVVIQALPKTTDTKEVAAKKFAALRARLEAARQNTLMYGAGAGGDLSSVLAN